MAIFNKSSIENRLDIDNVTDMVTVEKETMSIVWPDAKTVAMTALEFILFTITTGFCCWGISYAATQIVSKIL